MTTPARLVTAGYVESPIAQYQGNPLIEALPSIRAEADAAAALAMFPEEPGSEVGLSKEIRLHCIDRVLQPVQPLPIHLELESALASLIRSLPRGSGSSGSWTGPHGASNLPPPAHEPVTGHHSLPGFRCCQYDPALQWQRALRQVNREAH